MDKGGEYSLKWNSHKSTVMSAFTCLFENEKHADCTLAAEGRVIKAHKVMISACSPYLERLLEDHSKDKSSHPIVIFNDLSYFELKALCEYMYKGEVNVPMENLDNFLKVAKCMQVRGLCDGGGGDSIGGIDKTQGAKASPAHHPVDKRKQVTEPKQLVQQSAKRKRQDGGFESDTSTENVSYVTSPRGRGKGGVKQAKVIAACSPRVVQEVKPEIIKQEETETVYEETVYQDLTFEEEIYPQDPNNEASTSANETTIEFGNWNDGNSNDYNQDSSNQEQVQLFACAMCNKQYAKLKSLQSHQRYECGKSPEYACPHCPYRSKQKGYLNQHIQIKHTSNSQIFQCSKCDYRTKYKSNLNIHLRSVMHNPESTKRYGGNVDDKHLCQSCGKIYSSMSALRLHQNKGCPTVSVHVCKFCPFKTNIPASLNRHIMLKHNSNPIIYKCGHCAFMAPTSQILKNHLTDKHNEVSPFEIVADEDDESYSDETKLEIGGIVIGGDDNSSPKVVEVFSLDSELQ